MEKRLLIFVIVALLVAGAVYLALPALFNFQAKLTPAEAPTPVFPEFFLVLDPAMSRVEWQAGDEAGSVNLRFGEIGRNAQGQVTGVIAADMATIQASSPAASERLRSVEFFEVDRFPIAELTVTDLNYFGILAQPDGVPADNYELTGTLTVRGVSQIVRVPLLVTIDNNRVVARGEFVISRESFLLGPRDPSLPVEVKVKVELISQANPAQ